MKHCIFVYVINVDWYFELHWLNRALAVQESGANVHIIMGFTDSEITSRLRKMGFICHQWNIDRKSINPFLNFKSLVDLYLLLRSISPDIIHAITIKPNIYLGLISQFIRIPYILSVTGTGIVFSGKVLTVRLVRPIVRLLYKTSSTMVRRRIIFENFEDRDYFVKTRLCSSRDAVTILGAGVNTELFKPISENNTQTPIILFAARLLLDKGLGDLVEAGKLLRKKGLVFSIFVAGIADYSSINAIEENTLEQWKREGAIQWLGTEKNMPDLIAKSNIVVLPTFYGEGVPCVLIETASCGRAIVATDVPGCREIVRHNENGLLIPSHDSKALADAIEFLIKNPEFRAKMGARGRKIVEAEFSKEIVIKQTMEVYERLLSQKRKHC